VHVGSWHSFSLRVSGKVRFGLPTDYKSASHMPYMLSAADAVKPSADARTAMIT